MLNKNLEFEDNLDCNYYNKFALVQKYSEDFLFDFIVKNLKKESNILEIGFGNGNLIKNLIDKDFKYVKGIETSKKMLDFSINNKNLMQNVLLVNKDYVYKFKFKEEIFIVSNFAIQWLNFEDFILNISKNKAILIFPLAESFINLKNYDKIMPILNEEELNKSLKKLNINFKLEILNYKEFYKNELVFFKHLKNIGATSSKFNNVNSFKKIDLKKKITINYKIAFLTVNI